MMNDLLARARADFIRARFKAFLRRVRSLVDGRPDTLLSYNEVKEKLHLGGPVYRGVRTVEVDKIIGSLNRYHQFDRTFLPLEDETADRWQKIDVAHYRDVSLPPVVLYKVGETYFVVDGHHRVSVARQQGQACIEAEVRECSARVDVTPDLRIEDLESLGEKVEFLERTGLDRLRPQMSLELTIPDGFSRMLGHIAAHRYFMGLDLQRDVSEEEAVLHWHDHVYTPIIRVIRRSGILKTFPGKTEGDLYLWVLDRQRYLHNEGRELLPPAEAAMDFVEKVK